MFQAMLVRGDLANKEDAISCALSSSSPEGLVGFRWRIFSDFLCKRKRENCHKGCGAEGLLLPRECFIIGWSSSACFPCTVQCKEIRL